MKDKLIKINDSDNVAVALINLEAGETVLCDGLEIKILVTCCFKG